MQSVRRFGRRSARRCQDLVADPTVCYSIFFFKLLIDSQRASFGLKKPGIQTGWHRLERGQAARGGCRGEGEKKEEKKGKTWHGSVKWAPFVCSLGLSFGKEKPAWATAKLPTFWVFQLRLLFKPLGLVESGGMLNDVGLAVAREIKDLNEASVCTRGKYNICFFLFLISLNKL